MSSLEDVSTFWASLSVSEAIQSVSFETWMYILGAIALIVVSTIIYWITAGSKDHQNASSRQTRRSTRIKSQASSEKSNPIKQESIKQDDAEICGVVPQRKTSVYVKKEPGTVSNKKSPKMPNRRLSRSRSIKRETPQTQRSRSRARSKSQPKTPRGRSASLARSVSSNLQARTRSGRVSKPAVLYPGIVQWHGKTIDLTGDD